MSEIPSDNGGADSTSDRAKSIDGGTPKVSSRGDDQKTLLNKWGQRGVHVLLVVIPSILVLGILFQWGGVHEESMRYAQALVGLIFTITGLLAVVIVLYESFKKSRQTELSEFQSYK